jgi:hypothetical protein
MPEFSFEIVEQGHARRPAKVLTLPNGRAIWGYVEALALRILDRDGAYIRVKNPNGETVVRAGVSIALGSIESCPCVDCPLKRELRHAISTGHHSAFDDDLQIECELSGVEAIVSDPGSMVSINLISAEAGP